MTSKIKNIMIMISRDDSFGNNLIAGIIEYSKLCGNWTLTTQLPQYLEKHQSQYSFKGTGIDGVIAYIPNKEKADKIFFGDIPAVIAHETEENKIHKITSIVCDHRKIGTLASNFFKERGFHNIGFLGFEEFNWSIERQKGFENANALFGCKTKTFLLPAQAFKPRPQNEKKIISWLKSLHYPACVLCANDDLGLYLIKTCIKAEIKVPGQVAILGVDNNEMDCNLTTPSLSSISYNSQKAGFQAAETLDSLMLGKPALYEKIIVSPIGVINRMSTDSFAVLDEDVIKAINYIKINNRTLIQVDDVAHAINISRRNLSRKFKNTLGRSISDEIRRTKAEYICHLLADTNTSVSEIAYRTGFNDATHISRFFKEQTGITPLEYRRNYSLKTNYY
ncbi:MAG: hypothetical protein A2Y10_18625 [Planctomycetes bacterium GWF2_41_51]|nr:MAG: hypothetical protein A2Y10_18625 [Planctomycetes bacterium GWF2_41_51]HBG27137.1 hypothetical protein [Phycisphaerales bacterium]